MPEKLASYLTPDGDLTEKAKNRIHLADGFAFVHVSTALLQKVRDNPGLIQKAGGLAEFAAQERVMYATLVTYLDSNGNLMQPGLDLLNSANRAGTSKGSLAAHSAPFRLKSVAPLPETREMLRDVLPECQSPELSTLAQRPARTETPQVIKDALKGVPPPEMSKRSADNTKNARLMLPPVKISKRNAAINIDLMRKVEANPGLIQKAGGLNNFAARLENVAPLPETRKMLRDVLPECQSPELSALAQRPARTETPQVIKDALKGVPPPKMRKRSADNTENAQLMLSPVKISKRYAAINIDLIRKVEANPGLIQDAGGLKNFAAQEGVRYKSLCNYFSADGTLRPPAKDRLKKANGSHFLPITIDLLRKVEANPGLIQDAGGLANFAVQERVNYKTLTTYFNADGRLRPLARSRLKKANGSHFPPVTIDLLRKVEANPGLIKKAGGLDNFAAQENVSYIALTAYFTADGSLKPHARNRLDTANGSHFLPITIDLLRKVEANPGLIKKAGGLANFAAQERVTYKSLGNYLTTNGKMRPRAKNRIERAS
ncbi:hypothetical protein FB599_0442 [Herbaspirillum sp. SJZ130]|nr:hypothetical protein FB599_0442 [Herbaspirillum sp. SJZ130]TQK15038.1 hypothetical protein FB598_0380 [Herbaspirillum sp. SJZ106]TWC67395.1 hypothetical protein FB597_104206 [Herbaspirillum sp. SJZ099]